MLQQRNRINLSKNDILRQQNEINLVFKSGAGVFCWPLKIYFLKKNGDENEVKMGRVVVSVPKRNLKLAVHRNVVRRRIKEIWRINGIDGFDVGIVYLDKTVLDYKTIEDGFKAVIEKFAKCTVYSAD